MDACTVEVGLLRKHPCGEAAVAHCANCEQALCSKHAIAQLSPTGGRTGKFMCEQCNAAAKAYAKSEAAATAAAIASGRKPAPRPAPEAHKPAAPAAAAAKPAAAAAQKKPEPAADNSGPLEFTPEPKKPEPKK
jgi:hypothetical protein